MLFAIMLRVSGSYTNSKAFIDAILTASRKNAAGRGNLVN